MTAADYIFLVDPVWDLSKEMQAIKRAHRIGQTKPVFVVGFWRLTDFHIYTTISVTYFACIRMYL